MSTIKFWLELTEELTFRERVRLVFQLWKSPSSCPVNRRVWVWWKSNGGWDETAECVIREDGRLRSWANNWVMCPSKIYGWKHL